MSNNVEIILYVGQSKIHKTDKTSHTVRQTVQGQTLSDCPLKSRLAGGDTANKKSGLQGCVTNKKNILCEIKIERFILALLATTFNCSGNKEQNGLSL